VRGAGGRARTDDTGVSSIELVLYTPLLMTLTFLVVQFSMVYLGNQVAQSAAREGARVARVGGGTPAALAQGQARAQQIVTTSGRGLLVLDGAPTITRVGDTVRAVVDGTPAQVVPFINLTVHQVVQGPVERFVADTP
jgi:Flp pilus assembly protein TadG